MLVSDQDQDKDIYYHHFDSMFTGDPSQFLILGLEQKTGQIGLWPQGANRMTSESVKYYRHNRKWLTGYSGLGVGDK